MHPQLTVCSEQYQEKLSEMTVKFEKVLTAASKFSRLNAFGRENGSSVLVTAYKKHSK